MKTRLPKTLLIAVLAAMTQPGLAGETTTSTPDFTIWGTKVTPGVIVGTDGDVKISGNAQLPDGLMVDAPVNDGSTTYGYNKPYLKDGVNTKLTIENVNATFENPLYVREGDAYINNSNIVVACNPDQVILQVAGNDAEITFNNSSYAHDGSTKFMAIGGPDGKGTMNLVDSHVTTTTLLLGHSSLSEWGGTFITNSTATSDKVSDRYSNGEYTYSNRGNGERFFGEATVNVDANSTLTMLSTLYIAEATLNVNGGTVTTGAEAPYGVVLGKIIDSRATLNVTNGGKVISEGGFFTGDYFTALVVDHAGATILVDGKNDKGEASTLKTTGVLHLGYGVTNATKGAAPTTLTVTGGGKVEAGEITLGRDTDANLSNQVQVTVGTGSSIEGTSLNILEGASVSNSGTITVAGALTMSGGAELVFDLTELDMDNLPSLTVESLSMTDGAAISLIFSDVDSLKAALGIQEAVAAVMALTDEPVVYSGTDNSTILNKLITFTSAKDLAEAEDIELTLKYVTAWDDNGNIASSTEYTTSSITLGAVATAVPEPTTATLSLLALAGLCARRRRR